MILSEVQFSHVFGYRGDDAIVSHTRIGAVTFGTYKKELAWVSSKIKEKLAKSKISRVAIFCEDSFEFSLWFFAALSCAQNIVIPSNNKRLTAKNLGEQTLFLGDWDSKETLKNGFQPDAPKEMKHPGSFSGRIQLYTSGSSGEPQLIHKTLQQLLCEVNVHDQSWSSPINGTTTLATVSHQHIYGLLFKVLWPLVSGQAFVSKTYVDVAGLLEDAAKLAPVKWIASPAQLSRRMKTWPWHMAGSITDIFSSGGPLQAEDAIAIEALCGIAPTEVYGSTETGGIAWRRQSTGLNWNPLSNVKVFESPDGLLEVSSPWMPENFVCQDRIEIYKDGTFGLLGRADRIIKIEEKRISLSLVESLLANSEWIEKAHALSIERKRKSIAIVAILTPLGHEILETQGKARLVRILREFLISDLDGVALPRYWRFTEVIPTNQQGKTPRDLLMRFFDATPPAMIPHVSMRKASYNMGRIEFIVNKDLPCLPGHFVETPVVPGVIQIDWAMHFGRELLGLSGSFSQMEVIKFKKLMIPKDEVVLDLEFIPEKNKLIFCFRNSDGSEYSSGKLCFSHG